MALLSITLVPSAREVGCWESSGGIDTTLFLFALGSEAEVVGTSASFLLRLIPERVEGMYLDHLQG